MTGNDAGRQIFRCARRRLLATLMMGTALGVGAFPGALPVLESVAQTAQTHHFSIPSQPLNRALRTLADQSGIQIAYRTAIASGTTAPGVSGNMTAAQALSRLLAGTSLTYSFTDANTVMIGDRIADAQAPVTGDGSIVLDPITVTSGRTSSGPGYQGTPDWVYETPSSVSVVSGEAIRNSGARNVRDAIATTSGVYSGEGQGSFPTVSPNIRGISDSGRVVVSIDGARQNAQDGGRYGGGLGGFGAAFVDSAFIREADINKNPNASAGNAGSLGGGVDFRTVNANDIIQAGKDWGVEVNGSAGTNGFDYSGSVIASSRIGEHLAVTAGLSTAKLGDYDIGTNGVINTSGALYNMTGRESWSSLLKLEGEFGDVTTSLSWMHQQNDFAYTPAGGSNAGSTFDATNDSVTGSIAWNPDNPLVDMEAAFWLNNSRQDELRQARIVSGIVFAPETFQQRELLSFGGTLQNTSEINSAAGPLTFNYGVEAFRDDGSSYVMNDDIAADPRYASGYMQFNRPGQRDVASGFLNGKWEPTDWVTVSGGLRYDWYRLKGTSVFYQYQPAVNYTASCQISRYDYLSIYDPAALAALNPVLANIFKKQCGEVYDGNFYQRGFTIDALSTPEDYPGTEVDIDRTDGAWLPAATVEFKPFDWLRPYASYAHSARPPTINEAFFSGGVSPIVGIDTNGAANEDLRPETARTFEAGFNILQDGVFTDADTIRFKASAFHRTIEDYIVLGYIRLPGIDKNLLSFVNADGDTKMYGLELEGNYDAGTYWIGGAATWLETRWPDKTQVFSNETGTTSGDIFAFAGAVPPRFKVSVDAGVRLFEQRVTVGARVNHATPNLGRYVDVNGNLAETSDPYTTLDLHASFKLTEQATLNLAVNNVTDQLYVPATSNYIAPGRTFLASMNARF